MEDQVMTAMSTSSLSGPKSGSGGGDGRLGGSEKSWATRQTVTSRSGGRVGGDICNASSLDRPCHRPPQLFGYAAEPGLVNECLLLDGRPKFALILPW